MTYFVKEYKNIHKGQMFSNQQTDESKKKTDFSYEWFVNKPDMKLTVVDNDIPVNRTDVVYLAKKNAADVE